MPEAHEVDMDKGLNTLPGGIDEQQVKNALAQLKAKMAQEVQGGM
jgi:hypothetical protein